MTKAVIDGKAVYVGQAKAAVEAALGAPVNVSIYDPATTVAGQILKDQMKAHDDWQKMITRYGRGGKTYQIRFDEKAESVTSMTEALSW